MALLDVSGASSYTSRPGVVAIAGGESAIFRTEGWVGGRE